MRIFFLLLLFFAGQSAALTCDNEQVKSTLTGLKWVTEDYPPYNYLDKNEELKGIFTDTLLLIYRELELDIELKNIKVIPWARLYHQLTYEEGVAAFSMTNTVERSKRFKLIPIPYKAKISIMVKSDKKEQLMKKNLEDLSIAVVREDIGHHLLNLHDIPSTQVHTTSPHSMLKMLLHDRVDAIAYAEEVVRFQFEKLALDAGDIASFYTLEDNKVNSYIFHRNTDKCVISLFSNVIDTLKERGELDEVIARYVL